MEILVRHGALSANTVATVTLPLDADVVEVVNRGEQDLYFRIDGTDPAVGGNDSEIVPAGTALEIPRKAPNNTVVTLISTGTPAFTVRGLRR